MGSRSSSLLTRSRSEEASTSVVCPITSQSGGHSEISASCSKGGPTDQCSSPSRIPRSSSAQANLHKTRPSTHFQSRLLNHRTGESVSISTDGPNKNFGLMQRASRMRQEGPSVAMKLSLALRPTMHHTHRVFNIQNPRHVTVSSEDADELMSTDTLKKVTGEPIFSSPRRLERSGTFIVVASSSATDAMDVVSPGADARPDFEEVATKMRVEMPLTVRTPCGQESNIASYESAIEDFSLTLSADVSRARDDKLDEDRSINATLTTTRGSVKQEPLLQADEIAAVGSNSSVPAAVASPCGRRMCRQVEENDPGSTAVAEFESAGIYPERDTQPSSKSGLLRDTASYVSPGMVRRPVSLEIYNSFQTLHSPLRSDNVSWNRREIKGLDKAAVIYDGNDDVCVRTSKNISSCRYISAAEKVNPVKPKGERTKEAVGSFSQSVEPTEDLEPAALVEAIDAQSTLDRKDKRRQEISITGNRDDKMRNIDLDRFAKTDGQEGCESHKCLAERNTYLILQAKQKTPTNETAIKLKELASRLFSCAQLVTLLTPRSSPVVSKSLASLHESFRRATSLTPVSPAPGLMTFLSSRHTHESLEPFDHDEDFNANRPLQGNSRKDSATTTNVNNKQQQQEREQSQITDSQEGETPSSSLVSSFEIAEPSPLQAPLTPLSRLSFDATTGDICWGDRNGNRGLHNLKKADLDPAISRGFAKFTALCKGHLCRKLLASSRVQMLIRDIVDMVHLALGLHGPPFHFVKTTGDRNAVSELEEELDLGQNYQDVLLHERILLGLEESCRELHRLFFDITPGERVGLIRERRVVGEDVKGIRPAPPKRLTFATLKRRQRKLIEEEHETLWPSQSLSSHLLFQVINEPPHLLTDGN